MTRTIYSYRFFLSFLIALCFTTINVSFAQQNSGTHIIHFKNGPVSVNGNAHHWLDSMSKIPVAKEPVQVMIHFLNIPTLEQREELQANGIDLYDYVPDNTFSALVHFPVNTGLIASYPIHSIINAKPEWKADEYIWHKIAGKTGPVEILVSFFSGIDAKALKQFVAQMGGRVDPGPFEKYGSYKVIIGANKVQTMAEWYGVRYISPVTSMVPLDLQSIPAVKGNIAATSALYGGDGLLGDSVTVGIGDESSGIYHADIKDRITNFNPAPQSHHGEFVNGVVGGAANVDPLSASITPHVALVDHLFDLILPATGSMLHDYNMTITNNSYEVIAGDCSYAGTYDAYAQFLDTLAVQYPTVQHVFAAGNDGYNIVVGSMTDYLVQASDESRGPVKDGRLKPDIIAIGLGAYSDIGVDMYEWSAGTSMASPQVASGLAALTQRYKQLNGGTQPRADLLKTILLNGAMDLGNPGPDYSYGFGAMDLYRSLQILDNGHFYTNDIANGGNQTFTIPVPANTAQLKVMLYWNDVPASPSSAVQLVNDLDLTVTDPSLIQRLPLILDPSPANVNNNATEHADHLNNAEQVTITSPGAGNYTVNVKGYNIPQGPQHYVIAYDIIPNNIHLTFPVGGEQLSNVDSIRIFWNAVSDGNTFTVSFSTDNGTNWQILSNNVPADIRHYDFVPVGYNSGNCLVRVARNGTSDVVTSARFAISTQPVAQLDTSQCPGYINIHWSPVPNATSYVLLKKVGYFMQAVDSVADTVYSFGNMPLSTKSYIAVQPVINGIRGYRSVAVIAVANTGNCIKPVSTGDLIIDSVIAPTSGRMYTSSQFGATSTIKVRARDLYTVSCNNYNISYNVNSGPWQILPTPVTIPANGTAIISIPGLSFTDAGIYTITVVIHNLALADPQPGNDTVSFSVLNLPNDTMNLSSPFFDGFETMAKFGVNHDSVGVSPNGHWDYFNTDDSGRMRSFVNDDITITGSRSVSLDENQAVLNGSNNTFVGTFNLVNYDTATTEVRVDFDYILHGTPKTPFGNLVTARAADTVPWAPLFTYDLNAYPGSVTHVQSLSLTDAIRLSNHNFTSSTQVSFGQNDTSLIAAPNYGNGITLDNFMLYTVAADASLVSVVSPLPTNCGLPASVPLTVKVHNGVNYTLHNVQLHYSMDSGTVFSGSIDSIRAKDTVNYTFSQQLDVAPASTHTLNIWLNAPGDTYAANDSILNYKFRNSIIVTSYPYLENFEAGDGGYVSAGINNSWQYGTPAAPKIHKAASGTKAWKTNLTGNYNNLEKSYLYSPCFDISQLVHPTLSFSTAMDIENCGSTLCDAGYIEYSFDGVAWTKLGSAGQGTNWYDPAFDLWNTENFTRWHVATIPLPQPPVGQTIHFRFVLAADPGATFEGIAVDDIHIYDLTYPIFPETGVTSLSQSAGNDVWTDYVQAIQLLASVQPNSQSINNATVTLYAHDTLSNPGATQYTFPRNYTIKAPQTPTDSARVRLYLLDSDVVAVLSDTTCPSCTPVTDAYSLGITQYDNSITPGAENGSLVDDTGGVFTYYPYPSVTWVPYDRGYYAELAVKPFSEFWFNNGGPTGTLPAGTDYLNFLAFRSGLNVATYWHSLIDTAVSSYTLERGSDGVTFTSVLDTIAVHSSPADYTYIDPVNFTSATVLYYRLQSQMNSGSTFYSPVRRVSFADIADNMVTLNAQMIGKHSALVTWSSYIDGMVDHYILDRAIESNSYANIYNTPSARHYGQQYNFTDAPSAAIPNGVPVHYRLTAVLDNGTSIVLPIRTIDWDNGNSVVNIYPNPNYDGNITIVWHADTGTVMHVSIFDELGRNRYETSVTSAEWSNTTTLQTFRHAKGIYFVRFDIGGERYTAKMVYE